MNFTNGLAKDEFLQHMFEEFPSVFDNTFSRTLLENIVDYGTADNFTHTKNNLYYFLKDMIPEVEPKDLVPYMDKSCLTHEVLSLVNLSDVELVSDVKVRTMDELEDYLESKDWSIYKDEDGWDLRQASPAGEDFGFFIRHDDDVHKAINEIKEYAYDFDVDEHIAMWIEARNNGVGGVPNTRELVEDAKAIQDMLSDLADGVNWCEQMTIKESLVHSSIDDKIQSVKSRAAESHSTYKFPVKEPIPER